MVEFAANLGVSQGVISKYEAGKATPSQRRLLLLYELAQTPDEKKPIQEVLRGALNLGATPTQEELVEAVEALQYSIDKLAGEKIRTEQEELELRFLRLARDIHREAAPAPSVVKILDLWRRHGVTPGVSRFFSDAAAFLEVSMERWRDQGAVDDKRQPAAPLSPSPKLQSTGQSRGGLDEVTEKEAQVLLEMLYLLRHPEAPAAGSLISEVRSAAATVRKSERAKTSRGAKDISRFRR